MVTKREVDGRQIGFSVPVYIRQTLKKVASIEDRSVSSICAEAVFQYLERWAVRARKTPDAKLREQEKQQQ